MSDPHFSKNSLPLPTGTTPKWIGSFLQQIQNFSSISENWDSYGASAANPQSIQMAQSFIQSVAGNGDVEKPDLGLTPDGNVAFLWEWEEAKRNLDVELLPDGTIGYAFIDEDDPSRDKDGQTQDESKIVTLLTQR